MLACTPHRSEGQSAAELRPRVIAAMRNAKLTRDSLDALRAKRSYERQPDSLAAGSIVLRFSAQNLGPALQSDVQAAALDAWELANKEFGDAAKIAVSGAPIRVTRTRRLVAPQLSVETVELEIAGLDARRKQVRPPITRHKLADAMLDLIGTAATIHAPAPTMKWVGFWMPARRISEDDWRSAALDLASSNASVARTCYAGSVLACESSLGLTRVHDPLAEWYTPDGWHALVSEWQPSKEHPELIARHNECIVKRVAATCLELARMRPVAIPLNMASRMTLVGLALERGGQAGYARMLAATGTPMEVLAATAGISADSLVSEWRTRVLGALPRSTTPTIPEVVVLFAWTLLLGAAAVRKRP